METLNVTPELINSLKAMKNADLLVKLLKQFAKQTYGNK